MLAIVSSDKDYLSDMLEKVENKKEQSPFKTEIYKCIYKEHNFIVMSLGYGKVNISSSLRYLCDKYNIKAVITVGTAGSITDNIDIFSAVIPSSSLQFDVDFMPLGYTAAQIPNLSKAVYKTNEDLSDCLKKASSICGVSYTDALIATSDMFVSNYNLASSIRREYNAGSVDCESGSVGEFCYINDISYAVVKVISNFANNNAVKQYNLYDKESSKIAQRIIYKFLKEFYEA